MRSDANIAVGASAWGASAGVETAAGVTAAGETAAGEAAAKLWGAATGGGESGALWMTTLVRGGPCDGSRVQPERQVRPAAKASAQTIEQEGAFIAIIMLMVVCQKAGVTERRPTIPRSGGWLAPDRWHGYRSWTNANG